MLCNSRPFRMAWSLEQHSNKGCHAAILAEMHPGDLVHEALVSAPPHQLRRKHPTYLTYMTHSLLRTLHTCTPQNWLFLGTCACLVHAFSFFDLLFMYLLVVCWNVWWKNKFLMNFLASVKHSKWIMSTVPSHTGLYSMWLTCDAFTWAAMWLSGR